MVCGEVVGIAFLLGVLAVFAYYVYRNNCCPECGSFRSVATVEAEYSPVDDKTDGKDIIWHLMTEGEHRTKSSIVKWVDRCKKCNYQAEGERLFRHY